MTAPEEPGMGPVIRDNRRIDPVTGQARRGKHAASQPAGTMGAGRPGGPGARHGSAPAEEVTPPEGEPAPPAATAAGGGAQSGSAQSAPAESAQVHAQVQRHHPGVSYHYGVEWGRTGAWTSPHCFVWPSDGGQAGGASRFTAGSTQHVSVWEYIGDR